MLSDQHADAVDRLKTKLEEMHGHRMAVAMQKTRELDTRQAIRAQAQADTLRRVLHGLEHYQEGNEMAEEPNEMYVELSRVMREADKDVADKSDSNEPLRGLQ